MSYDLYCYRPTSHEPSAVEAEALLDAFNAAEEEGIVPNEAFPGLKDKLAAALIEHNPRLERFAFDYSKIAETQGLSLDEARARWQHIELDPPEGDPAIQLTIYNDHVFISIPYWYEGEEADRVFAHLTSYLLVIKKTAGYFAYDAQTGIAFDPERTDLPNHGEYSRVVKKLPEIISGGVSARTKPWWKFW